MRRLLCLILCMSVAACALTPAAQTDPQLNADTEKIAADAVEQLARLYPPAKTQFHVVASQPASFGAMLSDKLRAKGYAITESGAAATSAAGVEEMIPDDSFGAVYPHKAPADAKLKSAFPPPAPTEKLPGIPLRYVLDHSVAADLSRITLKIGDSLLARAYVNDNGAIAPAGAWTFKE